METKEKIFAKTLELVSKQGIRMMSMDTLAKEMGVSKKTIYHFYTNKDALVKDCVAFIISDLKQKLQPLLQSERNPILKIVDLYAASLEVVLQFPGAFFHDLQRLYPEANKVLDDFRKEYIFANVVKFLKEAKALQILLPGINIHLVCEIHFFRIVEIIDNFSLRSNLPFDDILKTLIVTNLRGILAEPHIQLLDEYNLSA